MKDWFRGVVWFLIVLLHAGLLHAQDKRPESTYQSPRIGAGVFDDKLGMLDREREEYATNLANYAAAQVVAGKASGASLLEARKLLALAMHLSPRNKKALVVNFQLRKGMLPAVDEGDYSAEVLARLLLTRAQLLDKQGGPQNHLLARCFIELAAQMDSRNEDAIYAYELQRIDHGDLDWKMLTDVRVEPEAPMPVSPPAGGGAKPPTGAPGK